MDTIIMFLINHSQQALPQQPCMGWLLCGVRMNPGLLFLVSTETNVQKINSLYFLLGLSYISEGRWRKSIHEKSTKGYFKKTTSDLKSLSQKLLGLGRGHLGKCSLLSHYSLLCLSFITQDNLPSTSTAVCLATQIYMDLLIHSG